MSLHLAEIAKQRRPLDRPGRLAPLDRLVVPAYITIIALPP